MARYFFHLHNDVETRDEEGVELPDLTAARRVAEHEARTIAAESVAHGRLCLGHSIEVADESGATVLVVRFGEVVEVVG
jgi:hypothetical protein